MLVALPLAVAGLPPGLMLVGETVRAILTAPGGDSVTLQAQDFPLQTSGSARVYYQVLRVPGDFFDAHRDQPVRVALDYELAIHGPQVAYELAAEGGELHMPRLGRCATIIGPFGNDVLLHCMQAGEERMRVDAALTDPAKGLSNPARHRYSPSDAPYRNGNDMIARFNATLFFRDDRTDTPYPVGAARIPEAKVRLSVSEPLAWMRRRVTIADVRLAAWSANSE